MKKLGLGALVLLFLLWGTNAFAVSYSYDNIFYDPVSDEIEDITENFEINISGGRSGQTLISVKNDGPDISAISAIYFLDTADLLSNVAFSQRGSTGSPVKFVPQRNVVASQKKSNTGDSAVVYGFSYKSNNLKFRVDANESAAFLVGGDFRTVKAALDTGELKIAIHVQHIGGRRGGSDTYLTDLKPVPEPATMLLLGAGLIGIAGLGRKKFFKKK